jgi:hypothetical protein
MGEGKLAIKQDQKGPRLAFERIHAIRLGLSTKPPVESYESPDPLVAANVGHQAS